MFTQAIPNGRRRTLDRNKKQLFCDAVARGATMTEAAVALGVSLRTVQREARRDAAFDQELRVVHNHPDADPLTLLKSHARRHWRASAWLLERQRPEEYGRRPASSCGAFAFEQALRTVLEAALEAAPPEDRAAIFERANAASERAFKTAFPAYDPTGRRAAQHQQPTPLADAENLKDIRNGGGLHIPDEVEPVSLKWSGSLQPVGWVDRPRQPITQRAATDGFPLRGEPILPLANEESAVAQEPEALARASTAPQPVPEPAKQSRVGAVHPPSPLPAQGLPHAEPFGQQASKAGASTHPTPAPPTAFTPRLSHRYPLRVAATANHLDPRSIARARANSLIDTFVSLLSPQAQSDTSGDTSLLPHSAPQPHPVE